MTSKKCVCVCVTWNRDLLGLYCLLFIALICWTKDLDEDFLWPKIRPFKVSKKKKKKYLTLSVKNLTRQIKSSWSKGCAEGRHSVDAALKTALLQTHFQQDWCVRQNAPVAVTAYFVFLKVIGWYCATLCTHTMQCSNYNFTLSTLVFSLESSPWDQVFPLLVRGRLQ